MSAITVYISAKATWTPTRRASMAAYSVTLARVSLQLRHHARIQQPGDVKIIVAELLELDDCRDIVGVRQQHHCGSLSLICGNASRGGSAKVWLALTSARATTRVFIEDDRGGETAHGGLEGQKLRQLVGSWSKTGLSRAKVDGHHHDVGAHDLRVIAQIGLGDDQRILDGRARAGRKQPVEAAIERDAGYDRHQDRRRRGDDREQADDAHVQPRGRAPGTARLHHLPDFAHDDAEQQQHRRRVHQQQRDDDVVSRRNRRQVGQNDEGGEGRQQRQATAIGPSIRRSRAGAAGASAVSAVVVRSTLMRGKVLGRVCASDDGVRRSAPCAGKDSASTGSGAFIQQCCQIATRLRRSTPVGQAPETMSRTIGMTLRP